MKKWIAASLTAMFITVGVAALTLAAGTENDWSAKLTFSTTASTDLLELTVGEGTSADELLKPPPLPGKEVTGDDANAIVNAYLFTTASSRGAARSIDVANANLPGKVWAIDVDVEELGATVSVSVDMDNFYGKYDLSVIDPETGTFTEIPSSGANTEIFKSSAGTASTKRLYLLAGQYQTLAVPVGGGSDDVFTIARQTGLGRIAGINVKIYDESCNLVKSGTTDSSGSITLSDVTSTGKHYVTFDGVRTIGSKCEMQISSSGSTGAACADLLDGDYNDDGIIDMSDLAIMKPHYNSVEGDDGWNAIYDITSGGGTPGVNMSDLAIFKMGYNVEESIDCN